MISFFGIVFLLLYCTLSVLWSLQQPGPGEREVRDRRGGDQMKRKAFNIVLVNLICFLVNYLPVVIYRLVIKTIQGPYLVLDLIICLGLVCGIIQPLLYLSRAGKLPCVNVAPPQVSKKWLWYFKWIKSKVTSTKCKMPLETLFDFSSNSWRNTSTKVSWFLRRMKAKKTQTQVLPVIICLNNVG